MLYLRHDRLKLKLFTTARRSTYVAMGGPLPSAVTYWPSPSAVLGRSSTSARPASSVGRVSTAPSSVELKEESSHLGLLWRGKRGSGLGALKYELHY